MISANVQAIGFVAQGIFASRLIIQWISSEKAQKVMAPTVFWYLSLFAAALLLLYSVLVKDLSILLGQTIGYYIYIRNLRLKRSWRIIPKGVRFALLLLPPAGIIYLFTQSGYSLGVVDEFDSLNVVLLWGLVGQLIFSCRFIYQWYYSEKVRKSVLPLGFWIISVVGSLLISAYALYLGLYPIIIGHLFGMVIYMRNIMIYYKKR
jgi:lipid-A-disaccharide synthase-like uncharacterized protein